MAKKKKLLKLVRDSIEKGATTAEDVHKSIAAMPLKWLKDIDVLRGPVGKAGKIQDHTIGSIYDLIRRINEQVGKLAAELLADATAAVEPASGNRKRPAAAKATKRAAARKRTVAATARKPAASKAKRSAAVASKRPSRKKTPA